MNWSRLFSSGTNPRNSAYQYTSVALKRSDNNNNNNDKTKSNTKNLKTINNNNNNNNNKSIFLDDDFLDDDFSDEAEQLISLHCNSSNNVTLEATSNSINPEIETLKK